jgi:RHH-type proline utilization regulon transcriptional repressor/proline dehydrogenase/delta 1-pyrroline-5-carboxylate dehydrogenase
MGPIIEPAKGKLLSALTSLAPGESWLVEPRKFDKDGQLWSPGVRDGVKPGSEFHLTEYFGPILGIMTADSLESAIDLVNSIDYGLTSGLHSLDSVEIETWLERIDGGNLYVNRGTTGAIVQRQPFGGWKKSAVGAGSKAGGPNYLFGLGTWNDRTLNSKGPTPTEPRVVTLLNLIDQFEVLSGVSKTARDWLRRAAESDEAAWASEFSRANDVSQVGVERNIFRYRPIPVRLRVTDLGDVPEFLRVVLAGLRSGSPLALSVSLWVSTEVIKALSAVGLDVEIESNHEWTWALQRKGQKLSGARIRLVGGSLENVTSVTAGRPDVAVWAGPVVSAGRVEMLPFLREQAVSITAHRFGTPNHLTDQIELGRS